MHFPNSDLSFRLTLSEGILVDSSATFRTVSFIRKTMGNIKVN